MTLTEMQATAQKTLDDFIRTMPDVPFTADDIIIEFAPRTKMVERAEALCALYVPDKRLNDSQRWELENTIGANALIGREKSAVLVRLNNGTTKKYLREIIFHELAHIFCGMIEMDGEHFIDVYGSGVTADENPENQIYDGQMNAGYVVWSEFIAQYYALSYVNKGKRTITNLTNSLFDLLNEVSIADIHGSKRAFAMVCSYLFLCSDVENFIELLDEPNFLFDDDRQGGTMLREAFKNCLRSLHNNLQKEKPWKISKDFIEELGARYLMFVSVNSVYQGLVNPTQFRGKP